MQPDSVQSPHHHYLPCLFLYYLPDLKKTKQKIKKQHHLKKENLRRCDIPQTSSAFPHHLLMLWMILGGGVMADYIMLWDCIMFVGVVNLQSGTRSARRGCQGVFITTCATLAAHLLWEAHLTEAPLHNSVHIRGNHLSAHRKLLNSIKYKIRLIVSLCSLLLMWPKRKIMKYTCWRANLGVLHKLSMSYHNPDARCLCFCS